MRSPSLAPLLLGLSLAAIGVGCGRQSSSTGSDLGSPASSAPGTLVRQPLGASSVGGPVKPPPPR